MRFKRLVHSLNLLVRGTREKRTRYMKEHNVLGAMGDNCSWGPWLVPVYPKLIRLHNNVTIHKTVTLIPHDMVNRFLKRGFPDADFGPDERLGCIEIMDNVYVANKVIIMPDVRINRNCIISADSVVTGDIPENSVVAGNPAKVIGRFDTFVAFRRLYKGQYVAFKNQELPDELALEQWIKFEKKRNKPVDE